MPTPDLIDEGKKAPAFTLTDQAGNKHRLSDYAGQWVILYFYPKDDTPGCTKQACGFRDTYESWEQAGVTILGISPDDKASHAKFAAKYDLPFPLLADEGAKVCQKFGVWREKNMYGRKKMGVVRTTYLIDPRGKMARRFDRVKVDRHLDQLRTALDEQS